MVNSDRFIIFSSEVHRCSVRNCLEGLMDLFDDLPPQEHEEEDIPLPTRREMGISWLVVSVLLVLLYLVLK